MFLDVVLKLCHYITKGNETFSKHVIIGGFPGKRWKSMSLIASRYCHV